MPSDLEKFLQQAAERLKDKIQQSQPPQRPQQPPRSQQTPPPVRSRQRLSQSDGSNPEVIEATVVSPRQLGDDPLSSIDTRPSVGHEMRNHLAENISHTDERVSGRVHQLFDHKVSTLPVASNALQSTNSKTPDQTNLAVEVDRRTRMSSPFLRMLRKPDTLRAAFLASEIFRRKF